ncbi:putative membrane protein [Caldibacillus thermoamylovorans]|jgi:hypothetical protein|uniref:Putative membrane protein n=1 Tax=Caldibacillus thermoamylovorans TaxID=35841 RepID=A0A090J1H6_9BACI|nr:hypothetical protein [Caldifermentibacillus hisashii]AWI12476.1 hypothetical protein CQJ30_10090 [Caldibacillus thermoamylovorans]KIO65377.1 hypothetical protein B4065_2592 [Caldibacillus thermoamylovorans]KIO73243.1 hypothetical protein B4167_2289 [Caldibacillus thermoamylovorans]PAC34282.1 hypothetical protein CEJ87_13970 [Caldifermentibacillus hisashii]CEE01710.1 putative membrane protein [Caldibacillus thermoamylovorans]
MNKKLNLLSKLTPILSILFIITGIIFAILAVLEHNMSGLIMSLVLILQSVLLFTYKKLFTNMGL